ncbi:DNA (cytosine-5)-methyltransferase 1 [Gemmobacter caeni]|uniref:Cytosine-specific methyltransferase n=1 Tax=Gemmobacter caeni TaxID=589035 RepID=A0A2T6AT71_9RHOB|nr:DNA (cytosine-5-)-methyltransferase [Gemmobacter caeni]PTX47018.1 DNA (cytosine-5)-methyltransferase 1 [Gemmobacter caeni]TWI96125.1 DNA (cytosine-5)-methyltransferase 1 [Gemmobacter caeni]
MSKYSVVSMFSGCGGMDLGLLGGFDYLGKRFKKNPFDIVWSNDLNKYACDTYEHNLKHKIHVGSIWDHIDTMPGSCDLLIGGFPCQDISINGKRRGIAGERSGLYRAMVEAVKRMRPKMFVAENVRGLLYAYNRESLETVISDFSELGYDVTYKLYLTADYGVPQSRERVLIVGVLGGAAPFVEPEPVTPKGAWIGSRKAIQDLEDVSQDKEFSHVWSLAKRTGDQGGRVLNPERPSPTIRAECHGNNSFHYSLPRRISMREAARFQSFPDNFIFKARLRETERMIGNAVPPVFAWHVAQSIRATLDAFETVTQIDKVLVAAE